MWALPKSLVVLAVVQGLDGQSVGVIERGQLQLLHDFKANIKRVRAASYPFRKGRNATVRPFNQVD